MILRSREIKIQFSRKRKLKILDVARRTAKIEKHSPYPENRFQFAHHKFNASCSILILNVNKDSYDTLQLE